MKVTVRRTDGTTIDIADAEEVQLVTEAWLPEPLKLDLSERLKAVVPTIQLMSHRSLGIDPLGSNWLRLVNRNDL